MSRVLASCRSRRSLIVLRFSPSSVIFDDCVEILDHLKAILAKMVTILEISDEAPTTEMEKRITRVQSELDEVC